jgi:D-sedoheptulose 7-phosphate isomerase
VSLEALRQAVLRKSAESRRVQEAFFAENADRIVACSQMLAASLAAGGRLLAMGNGGSACDAQHAAVEFMHPVIDKREAFGALAIGTDIPLLTAVGNDEDFAVTFSQQLRLLARPNDVVLAISTSGKARNVVRAAQTAREMELPTVGFTGRDGGKLAELCTHTFCVKSFSIHRIQEAHETLLHVLWDLVHLARGAQDVL